MRLFSNISWVRAIQNAFTIQLVIKASTDIIRSLNEFEVSTCKRPQPRENTDIQDAIGLLIC